MASYSERDQIKLINIYLSKFNANDSDYLKYGFGRVKLDDIASPINDFEGFLHIFYWQIKNFTESLTEKLVHQVG
jgi:hypothetical protein